MLHTYSFDFKTPLGILDFATNLIVVLCVMVLFLAVFLNFVEGSERKNVKKQKQSIVATGTMTGFFVIYFVIIKSKIGTIILASNTVRIVLAICGLSLIIGGCVINILGRLALGHNWANHIKIYNDHTLVRTSVYKVFRHPLYAGIIYMFYGASLVYLNWVAFLANTMIFIPFMYLRAKQEEALLLGQFKEYTEYIKTTGMFFPKLFVKYKR